MKRFFICLIAFLSAMMSYSLVHHVVVINQNDGTKTEILTNEIDSITFSSLQQVVWTKDSIYSIYIPSITNTTISKIDPSAVIVKTKDIDDWSEMRLCVDGTLMLMKQSETGAPKEVFMAMPSEELGVFISYIFLDDNAMPKSISVNNYIVFVDAYTDSTIDLTVAYSDSVAYSMPNLSFAPQLANTRAWYENNWQRNVVGVLELVGGALSVGVGSGLIASSGVAEVITVGGSTPVSVPGMIAGSVTFASGCNTFKSGYDKLFMPGEHSTDVPDIFITLGSQALSEGAIRAPECLPGEFVEKYADILADPQNKEILGKLGWTSLVLGLAANILDYSSGQTVTWQERFDLYKKCVLTGEHREVTSTTAIVSGFVLPEILIDPLNNKKIENEYGIIVNTNDGDFKSFTEKVVNGNGGAFEYVFERLKPKTTYTYQTYFRDKTHDILIVSDAKTFKTKDISWASVTGFRLRETSFQKGAFQNNGNTYDYKFDAVITVAVNKDVDKSYIEYWGYMFEDQDGQKWQYPCSQYTSSYTYTRIEPFYRNSAKSTVKIYGYVKFYNDDTYYCDEPRTYELRYSPSSCPDDHHHHVIDLGLPSGTKWACCNVEASSPGEYGGYYAWGETKTKPVYDWDHYLYLGEVSDVNIGLLNIAGTSYDVAHIQWGGQWRMPSFRQCVELLENCSVNEFTFQGIEGWQFTGRNGASIFLPKAGYFSDNGNNCVNGTAVYWTSTFDEWEFAYWFYLGDKGAHNDLATCYLGLPVRPVCP